MPVPILIGADMTPEAQRVKELPSGAQTNTPSGEQAAPEAGEAPVAPEEGAAPWAATMGAVEGEVAGVAPVVGVVVELLPAGCAPAAPQEPTGGPGVTPAPFTRF